jgi:fumarylacetoacetate (FAA) hydrolase family protein
MAMGPVIQVFRADRLPDDVGRALLGIIVFEEDGLQLAGVRASVREFGFS